MDNVENRRQPEPIQQVKMGEWVRPLAGITERPDIHRGSDFRTKAARLELDGQRINLDLNASGFSPLPRLRIITGMGEEDVTGEEAEAWERRFEARLFSASLITADEMDHPDGLPIRVSLKTPAGKVYCNNFLSPAGEDAFADMRKWKEEGDPEEQDHFLLFPEIEQILEGVWIRFDPLKENT